MLFSNAVKRPHALRRLRFHPAQAPVGHRSAPRGLQRREPRPEVVRLRGGARAGAGRARHHPAGGGRRDRPQGQGRERRPRGDRRGHSHRSIIRWCRRCARCRRCAPTATANISISGRPPRTCSTPAPCCSSRRRTASSCATSRRSGARSYRARRKVQGHADGRAHPCGAGAAHHLRPQMRDLAFRDRPQLRAAAAAREARPSSAAWSARSAPRPRSATAPSSSTPW